MKKITKKEYTEYLNNYYAEMDFQDVLNDLIYLYKGTGSISVAYHKQKIGELIRRKDKTRFNVGYRDYVSEKEYERENHETI